MAVFYISRATGNAAFFTDTVYKVGGGSFADAVGRPHQDGGRRV